MSKSVEKAFLLLNLVAAGHTTLSELARASSLPVSTIHRLLAQLVGLEILSQDHRTYRLGVRLIELGEKAKTDLRIGQIALGPMRELARATQETVHLGILDGEDIVYLEKVGGERGLQMASYVGLRTPAQCTAMGKALIASLPEAEWAARFRKLRPRTANTISTKKDFLTELANVKEVGYALDREENEVGIRCVAAPILDASGAALAAVSLSGASVYIDLQRQRDLAPAVIECARQISQRLGFPSMRGAS